MTEVPLNSGDIAWMLAASALVLFMTPGLAFWLFVLTVGMCAISALSAIVKVTKIDPATVFNR